MCGADGVFAQQPRRAVPPWHGDPKPPVPVPRDLYKPGSEEVGPRAGRHLQVSPRLPWLSRSSAPARGLCQAGATRLSALGTPDKSPQRVVFLAFIFLPLIRSGCCDTAVIKYHETVGNVRFYCCSEIQLIKKGRKKRAWEGVRSPVVPPFLALSPWAQPHSGGDRPTDVVGRRAGHNPFAAFGSLVQTHGQPHLALPTAREPFPAPLSEGTWGNNVPPEAQSRGEQWARGGGRLGGRAAGPRALRTQRKSFYFSLVN